MPFITNERHLPKIKPFSNSLDELLVPFERKTKVGETVVVEWRGTRYTMIRNDARDNRCMGSYFSNKWGTKSKERIN